LDGKNFDVLKRVNRVCGFPALKGQFRSKSGYLTWVVFRPSKTRSGEDRFAIARIERFYHGFRAGSANGKALIAQFNKAFGNVPDATMGDVAGAYYIAETDGIVLGLYDTNSHASVGYEGFVSRKWVEFESQKDCPVLDAPSLD